METRIIPPLFLIMTITLALLGSVSQAQAAQPVPLEWHDNPNEFLPGYKIELRVHAFGAAATGLFPAGYFADAAGCVNDLCFGVVGDDGLIPVQVRIRMAGYEQEIDKIWVGYKEYDAYFTLKLYCPGEDIAGIPVDENHAVLEVYSYELGRRDYYVVDVSGSLAPDLRGFYEQTYTGQRSWYEFYDPVKFKDCGGDYIGDLPDGGSGNAPNDDQQNSIDIEKYAMYGIAAVVGLGALAIIVNRR